MVPSTLLIANNWFVRSTFCVAVLCGGLMDSLLKRLGKSAFALRTAHKTPPIQHVAGTPQMPFCCQDVYSNSAWCIANTRTFPSTVAVLHCDNLA